MKINCADYICCRTPEAVNLTNSTMQSEGNNFFSVRPSAFDPAFPENMKRGSKTAEVYRINTLGGTSLCRISGGIRMLQGNCSFSGCESRLVPGSGPFSIRSRFPRIPSLKAVSFSFALAG